MDIGKEKEETITVEPITNPVPEKNPAPSEPVPVPETVPAEPEKVPA